ncbi:hypothetical protein CAP40_17920 [Sphingomonas sp. IBVSS2]|uniref:hypothetical protein n=1 Tax=Sphingomonas sp. IBVSS2 TaxID=1985172 RepID=UPI000A2D2B4C|nr:hypothetical protein [Sphingomonas sp. IBVSS2]OSZ63603.1 hypothetical protein CAP40_17920 [Sphingomonas sp. IBVSS2]
MAAAAHSAPDGAWNTQFQNYLNLIQQLEHAEPRQHERLERARAEVQDALLDMPAPTLTAVLQKLAILFEGELHGLDQASEERRLILEDFEGLIQAQSALLGA